MKYFLITVLIIGIYLNRTYAYFYNYQGSHFIANPDYPSSHLFQKSDKFETKKLAFLGDSLMRGTGSTKEENSLPYLIASNLAQDQNIEMHNFSHPGVGINDVYERQLPEVLKLQPNYVILMIGTNDVHNKVSISTFNDLYRETLNRLLSETNAQVSVVNIPLIGSNRILVKPWDLVLDSHIQEFNKVIASHIPGKRDVKLIDLYSQFENKFIESSDLYAVDEFHPSDKGYSIWASYINSQIER